MAQRSTTEGKTMNSLWSRYGFVLMAGMFLVAGCTSQGGLAGNSSQTPNALVGTLYEPDGVTPAKDVRVHIRPRIFFTVLPGAGSGEQLTDTVSAVTDGRGWFAFDTTLEAGMYVVEAKSGNNVVFADSIAIVKNDGTDTLAPLLLKPAGVIKGAVRLSEGGNPRKVFVRIAGIDRFTTANDDGIFAFCDLAESHYDINIIPTLDNYDVFDTVNVSVRPADTTDLGIIELPFTDIPTVKRLTASYDTLMQQVTLYWEKPKTGLVTSFNVYRRVIDPPNAVFTQLNMLPIVDTNYTDTHCEENKTYEYRITAVDSNTNEGKRSAGVTVGIAVYEITPAQVSVAYDTLKQTVIVHWNNPDPSLVTGYNVYRRNIDLGETFRTPLNNHPIIDTLFVDSMFAIYPKSDDQDRDSMDFNGPAYEYCVRAVIGNVREGAKSTAAAVRVSVKLVTPIDVQAVYDTVKHTVRLCWNVLDTTLLRGYAVFRQNADAGENGMLQLTSALLTAPCFTDTTGRPGQAYEYRIASMLKNGRATVVGGEVTVRLIASQTMETMFVNVGTDAVVSALNGEGRNIQLKPLFR
jgi:hypothetical protein